MIVQSYRKGSVAGVTGKHLNLKRHEKCMQYKQETRICAQNGFILLQKLLTTRLSSKQEGRQSASPIPLSRRASTWSTHITPLHNKY